MRRLFVVLLALASAAPLAAQTPAPSPERWQITLQDGEIVWDVRLARLEGEALLVTQADSSRRLAVGQITELRLLVKSEIRIGEGVGRGVFGALTGADDEVYDLTPLEFAERMRAVQQILLRHPPPPAAPPPTASPPKPPPSR